MVIIGDSGMVIINDSDCGKVIINDSGMGILVIIIDRSMVIITAARGWDIGVTGALVGIQINNITKAIVGLYMVTKVLRAWTWLLVPWWAYIL